MGKYYRINSKILFIRSYFNILYNLNCDVCSKSDKSSSPWKAPELESDIPSPDFGGGTGGLQRKAQVEEFYLLTWIAKSELLFELSSFGVAKMLKGKNLLKLSRKEQCLALSIKLRNTYKINAYFYRIFPNGEIQYLHPFDGIYPEKVKNRRLGSNQKMRLLSQNIQPFKLKFTGKGVMDV